MNAVKDALRRGSIGGAEIGIIVCDDRFIAGLNRRYCGRSSPTDCLAFQFDEQNPRKNQPRLLGDVVVSAETAERYAARMNVPLSDEIVLYAVHGVLHLLGYEDKTSAGRRRMQKIQEAIVKDNA